MNQIEQTFLNVLRASLRKQILSAEALDEMQEMNWPAFFRLADQHHVLPMIYGAVYPLAQSLTDDESRAAFAAAKQQTILQTMNQVRQTAEFYQLYAHLEKIGIRPIITKGILCRTLYPDPDARISGDEDLVIADDEMQRCHEALLDFGMVVANDESAQQTQKTNIADVSDALELSYGKIGSPLYIEVHTALFPQNADAYGSWNELFEGAEDRCVDVTVDGHVLRSLAPTDHFLYLICHAFKHFLHSGFGIRQVCDIVMYANAYGAEIDWKQIYEKCAQIRAEKFTAALFRIGEKYLVLDPEQACVPAEFTEIDVDEELLLNDLLDAGVYGASSRERQHSSTMTLNAVTADREGKTVGKGSLLKTVFPPAKDLEGRYPYLKKNKLLLPIAWTDRIRNYQKELRLAKKMADAQGTSVESGAFGASDESASGKSGAFGAAKSIEIGEQRIELFREYGIIREE